MLVAVGMAAVAAKAEPVGKAEAATEAAARQPDAEAAAAVELVSAQPDAEAAAKNPSPGQGGAAIVRSTGSVVRGLARALLLRAGQPFIIPKRVSPQEGVKAAKPIEAP